MTTDILSPIANTNLHPIKSIWLYELMLLFTENQKQKWSWLGSAGAGD